MYAGAVSRKSQTARSIQSARTAFGLRHAPAGGGILTPFPSATAVALALGVRLTLRGSTLRRNPWTFGVRVSHPDLRYSCQHSRFRCLQHISRCTFAGLRNAPLPLRRTEDGRQTPVLCRLSSVGCLLSSETRSFGAWLEPRYIFRRRTADRPVSYYAFFKGWLLLSQPPGCLGLPTSFPT